MSNKTDKELVNKTDQEPAGKTDGGGIPAKDVISIKRIFLYLGISFIVAAGLIVASHFITTELLKQLTFEFGKAVVLGVFITGTLNRMIANEKKKEKDREQGIIIKRFQDKIDEITGGLETQAEKMRSVSASFDAMLHTGIKRIFKSREEIIEIVRPLFGKEDAIYICGVSLNDFLRDEHRKFYELWNDIVLERLKTSDTLKVKILIINPDSRGAIHRKSAESTHNAHINWNGDDKDEDVAGINNTLGPPQGRLAIDVNSAIGDLMRAVDEHRGKLEVHLYNCDPIMFLIWTKPVSFVQQYQFRPTHKNYDTIPVVAYEDITHSGFQSYHRELEFHFYWIWTYYSTDIAEYARKASIGIDKGIIGAGIRNVYYDARTCKDRIISLINDTKDILWIRGVSLRSFFVPEGEIYNALKKKYLESPGIDLQIILIDMASESAKKRSYREYKINHGTMEYNTFIKDGVYEEQKLYADTRQTLNYLEIFKRDYEKPAEDGQKNSVRVRVSGEDPEGFFFFTDKSVLVEQYHFGKLEQDSSGQKLGGEVPVFEFVDNGQAKQYSLYKTHFEYLFNLSREPPWRGI